jgi:hypothetical protein
MARRGERRKLDFSPILGHSRGDIMRLRWTLCAALLLTLAAWGESSGVASQPSRLGALAARQSLCDLVYYAMADGTISRAERAIILQQAKSLLTPQEYASFHQTIDRISPPVAMKPVTKLLAKATHKRPVAAKPTVAKPDAELVVPASANLPDGMAQPVFLR